MNSKMICIGIALAALLPSHHTHAQVVGNESSTNNAGKARTLSQNKPGFRLLVFGDSLSDTGNAFAASQNGFPDPDLYFHGRASDKFVWPDYLDASVNGSVRSWAVTNYAYNTATACPGSLKEFVLSVPKQVSNFLGGVPPPSSHGSDIHVPYDSVIILAGSNDYYQPLASLASLLSGKGSSSSTALLDSIVPHPQQVVSCIMDSVYQLVPQFQKPTTLLVAGHNLPAWYASGVPSLEKFPVLSAGVFVPKALAEIAQAAISVAVQSHNKLLKERVSRFQSLEIPRSDVRVKYLDFEGVQSDVSNLGYSVTDQPCLEFKTLKPYGSEDFQSACKDPSGYLFFDSVHFTSSFYLELAKFFAAAIED